MFTKVFRKSLILLASYALIIIGIFVVQFKNDSIISEKIGSLHITLVESTTEDNTVSLKNKFNAVFNGMSFFVNDENPAKISRGRIESSASLVSWKKEGPLSCVFYFSEGASLRFSLSDETSNALLNIETTLPQNATGFSVPYALSGGATLTEQGDTRLQINSKKNRWELSAADIVEGRLYTTRKNPVISYAYYDKTRNFSFSAVAGIDGASESAYKSTIASLEDNIVSAFEHSAASDASSITEQEAVSYVAVRASKGQYAEAVEAVPQGFRRSSNRTYLSAPYFNNLARMNESLIRQQQTFSDMISISAENGSLDVFALKNLSDYMTMHPGSASVVKLLSGTGARDLSEITLLQAAGILSVYTELSAKNTDLANMLSPALKACADKIESSCSMDNETLTIVEKGTFLSVVQAVYVGDAILRYGRLVNNSEYIAGGRLIINSYLKDSGSFDSRSLGELYPVVVHNNSYYPHYAIMGFDRAGAVWAWTCAQKISYRNDGSGQIAINVTFPVSNTHYLIVNGIQQFRSIYIYDMAFRTDSRFETYNSSGYVYQRENGALLLKSRHRSEEELIRLVYSEPASAAQTSAPQTESPDASDSERTSDAGTENTQEAE